MAEVAQAIIEQKSENEKEAAWIKERQHKCRAMEAEYMRELQENSEKEKREIINNASKLKKSLAKLLSSFW